MSDHRETPNVPDSVPIELWQSAGHNLFEWVTENFVVPEVQRRVASGAMGEGNGICAAQVVFRVNQAPEVRLNDEVQGQAEVSAPEVPREVGQKLSIGDIESVSGFLLPEGDADAAHITLFVLKDAVNLVFDGSYSAGTIERLLGQADEFVAMARHAASERYAGPFVESAFAATELLAKSELLSLPEPRVHEGKKHSNLHSLYNQWANLGNTEQRFADLLNRLTKLRKPARYGEGDLSLDDSDITSMLADLEALRMHVEEARPKRTFEDRKPRRLTAIATQPLKAGEVVDGRMGFFK